MDTLEVAASLCSLNPDPAWMAYQARTQSHIKLQAGAGKCSNLVYPQDQPRLKESTEGGAMGVILAPRYSDKASEICAII